MKELAILWHRGRRKSQRGHLQYCGEGKGQQSFSQRLSARASGDVPRMGGSPVSWEYWCSVALGASIYRIGSNKEFEGTSLCGLAPWIAGRLQRSCMCRLPIFLLQKKLSPESLEHMKTSAITSLNMLSHWTRVTGVATESSTVISGSSSS